MNSGILIWALCINVGFLKSGTASAPIAVAAYNTPLRARKSSKFH